MNAPLDPEVERWLSYARMDLHEVRLNLAHGGTPNIACYHAQQAAEKALKALLIARGLDVPRIHDLDKLKKALPDGASVKTVFPDLSELTFWGASSRYPGEWPEASPEDARESAALAERVFEQVLAELGRQGQ